MSWLNRLKLLSGIVIIVLIVGLLTLLFNQRQNQVASIATHVHFRSALPLPAIILPNATNPSPGAYHPQWDTIFQ